jgi:hypothetical protein
MKEATVFQFQVLFRPLSEGSEENLGNLLSIGDVRSSYLTNTSAGPYLFAAQLGVYVRVYSVLV